MVIGVLQFELLFHDAQSLKDKRRVIRSLRDRLHREHLVSVSEVGANDKLNVALMGVAVVAPDGRRAGHVLDAIEDKLRKLTDAELGDITRELLHGEPAEMSS